MNVSGDGGGGAEHARHIDALVVAEAIESGGANILTGDPDDFRLLAQSEATVIVHPLTQLRTRRMA